MAGGRLPRTTVALAFAGGVDEIFGPAIERVGPEFALSDGEAEIFGDVVG